MLRSLRERKTLCLVSNFDHPPAIDAALRQFGLADYFSAVVVSGEVGFHKPDPRIFEVALKKPCLLPEEVVHVGDSKDDVVGALSARITPILIRHQDTQTSDRDAAVTDKWIESLDTAVISVNDLPSLLSFIR